MSDHCTIKIPRRGLSWPMIKALLEEATGLPLTALSRTYGLHRGELSQVNKNQNPRSELIIAANLGLKPWVIWPTRWNDDGTTKGRVSSYTYHDYMVEPRRRNGKKRRVA